MAKKVSKEQILKALDRVLTPSSAKGLVKSGMVNSIFIKPNNNVGFAIEINPAEISPDDAELLRSNCEKVVSEVSGVASVTAVLTAETGPGSKKEKLSPLVGVKHIIAVGSGKGGVGKSTVAVNLAMSLNELGYKVGLVDADILGPSLTKIIGISDKPESDNGQIIPLEKNEVKFVSIGLLIEEETPIVWRGPMIGKALSQLMNSKWGELDYLIIDLPPGTGDVQITLSKYFPISGAVVVTTPQKVALMDVKKAIGMFERMNIPVLGIVENMSYFQPSGGKEKNYIFGKNNVNEVCKEQGLGLITSIPLLPLISEKSDAGEIISAEECPQFLELAKTIAKKLKNN